MARIDDLKANTNRTPAEDAELNTLNAQASTTTADDLAKAKAARAANPPKPTFESDNRIAELKAQPSMTKEETHELAVLEAGLPAERADREARDAHRQVVYKRLESLSAEQWAIVYELLRTHGFHFLTEPLYPGQPGYVAPRGTDHYQQTTAGMRALQPNRGTDA